MTIPTTAPIAAGAVTGRRGTGGEARIARFPPAPPAILFRRMFETRDAATLGAIAGVKRFVELYVANPELRETLTCRGTLADPQRWLIDDLPDVRALQPIWDRSLPPEAPLDRWPLIDAYVGWRREAASVRSAMREMSRNGLPDQRFAAWRERQIARLSRELPAANADALTHPVAAFELSSGCRLGCWFCAVSAQPFRGHAPYATSSKTWQRTIAALVGIAGAASRSAVCYWATDPGDNPDYPAFIADFARQTGFLPATTTAAALRDPAATAALLTLSRTHGCGFERFSVTSDRQLRALHAAYRPRELLDVELVIQTKGTLVPRVNAGRARDPATDPARPTTIACVSGFLVNLVEMNVRLVTPCPASDDHPDGMLVLGERRFDPDEGPADAFEELIDGYCTIEERDDHAQCH